MSETEPVVDGVAVATAEDEAAVVQGVNTQDQHPDNEEGFAEPELSAPDGEPAPSVSDEELAEAVAAVDPEAVDLTGHDESDAVVEPNDGSLEPPGLVDLPDPDDILPA